MWLWSRFVRCDIANDRPGLKKIAAYAHYGAGAPAGGPLRTAEIWWHRITVPFVAWGYWKAWALERPFRGWLVLIGQVAWLALNAVTLVRLL